MSVIVVTHLNGDPAAIKSFLQGHDDDLQKLGREAKNAGALHSRFAEGKGEVVILQEWHDSMAFEEFFASNEAIRGLSEAVGADGDPKTEVLAVIGTAGWF